MSRCFKPYIRTFIYYILMHIYIYNITICTNKYYSIDTVTITFILL